MKHTEHQSDMIKTDATLRGVKFIDYNQMIENKRQDLETLKELTRKHGLMDAKSIKELENKITNLEMQTRDWLNEVEIVDLRKKYIITILIEEVKT